ncbi:MAG: 50S ribosomal protein L25 [Saprospiraceae bacterium]
MQTVAIQAEARHDLGKKNTKAARREGLVPGVLYGAGDPVHFTLRPLDVRDLVYTPDFKTAEVTIGGTTTKAILKEVQFHPVTDEIQHIDFLALQQDQVVKVDVPVRPEGVSVGVLNGGKLQQNIRRVRIKTTPSKLVDSLKVNISKLKMGQSARVRDIQLPEGIELMTAGATPVVTVVVPRAMRSAATAEAKAAAEGEEGEEGEGGEETAAAE